LALIVEVNLTEPVTAIAGVGSAEHNIYGCTPCPVCGSKARAPYDRGPARSHIGMRDGELYSVECSDCGFAQPGVYNHAL
jgi:hypothetical protein